MKVFLSHSQRDIDLARNIAAGLRREGLGVWLQEEELLPGDNWAERTSQALAECDSMVALLTPNAVQSGNVQWELSYAMGNKSYRKRVIPVVFGNNAEDVVPWILERFSVVRLATDEGWERAVHEIASRLLTAA